MKLILIRHGESEGNASGIVQGHLDFGLTALGRAQAEATAVYLAATKADRLVSSPLRRAFETASLIAGSLGLQVESDSRLMEYDIGAASGLTGPQIRERFPDVVAQWQKGLHPRFPGEEGRDIFSARIATLLDELVAEGKDVVAVAHGGVVGAFCRLMLGMDPLRRGVFETANCGITEIAIDRQGRRVLQRVNDTCHLGSLMTMADRR